jgi:glycosyltransferase involved in cell wall biosynthesis
MDRWEGFKKPNVQRIQTRSSIFSLSEQWEIVRKIPSDSRFFWSPNYNFPILYKGKLLVTVHDVFHLANPQFVFGSHRRFYAKFMFKKLVGRANEILCVSRFTKGELLKWAGGDAGKMNVIHNGVDPSWLKVEKKVRPHPKPYFLFVGNVKPHKNLGRLLRAFAFLKDRIPHDLILAGKKEGFITGDLKVIKEAEGFGDRVQFTGMLDDEQLRQFYAYADLLVFPSLYEGFGLPPLEAMAGGTPVACSNAASLPEVCGDAVLYFDPYQPRDMAEKIEKALTDIPLRERLIKKGMEQVVQFTWEKTATETVKVMERLF